MTFKGIITKMLPETSGMSKAGKPWRKREYVLTYDNTNPQYPKEILFSVMNENIDRCNLQLNGSYEVEIDFNVHEYNGKSYMQASCWRVNPPVAAQPQMPTPQAPQYSAPTAPGSFDNPPF